MKGPLFKFQGDPWPPPQASIQILESEHSPEPFGWELSSPAETNLSGEPISGRFQSAGRKRRNSSEFVTTDTELKPIAAPANTGCRRIPRPIAKRTPAATGMKAVL